MYSGIADFVRGDKVVDVGFIRAPMDSEFISQRPRQFHERVDLRLSYIEPGSSCQKGYYAMNLLQSGPLLRLMHK